MRKKIVGCIVVLSFGALLSGGCAKKDMVRTEEPIPAVQTPPRIAPETEVARPAPRELVKPAPFEPTPIPETPTREGMVRQEAPSQAALQPNDLQGELQKIYFNFDSAALSEESRSALSKNAEFLVKQPSLKVRVEGNCDERGSDDYNMALGERRAQAARDYLINLGVQPERLSIISYGEEKPADPGHDEAAWAKNRRDEFVIVK
ncbi:MAG: peptidoglycan-associated lipoprotein [Geobacteraceae bacterium GWC2_58_44]|nr:MAG: peptidoglycan-associated lipoprotein [Geobacteraceae bacterium GWC2_58_44]